VIPAARRAMSAIVSATWSRRDSCTCLRARAARSRRAVGAAVVAGCAANVAEFAADVAEFAVRTFDVRVC